MIKTKQIKTLIKSLDQKDRMERKIKFLLDLRGYFNVNKIKGDYVEFGVFEGEMIYAANIIYKDNINFNKYIGLDTFSGTPQKKGILDLENKFIEDGDYSCSFKKVKDNLKSITNLTLIKGDFREAKIKKKFMNLKTNISMLVVDCNLISSVKSCLSISLKRMLSGSVIYMDDMYISQSSSFIMKQILYDYAKNNNINLEPYQFYPPFGRAFFIFRK